MKRRPIKGWRLFLRMSRICQPICTPFPSFHTTTPNDLAYNSSAFPMKFCHMFCVHWMLSELLGNCLLYGRIISSTSDNLKYWIPCSNVFHLSWCTARSSCKSVFPLHLRRVTSGGSEFLVFSQAPHWVQEMWRFKAQLDIKPALFPPPLLITQKP